MFLLMGVPSAWARGLQEVQGTPCSGDTPALGPSWVAPSWVLQHGPRASGVSPGCVSPWVVAPRGLAASFHQTCCV